MTISPFTDDWLGEIAFIPVLGAGETVQHSMLAEISETVTNTAYATGTRANGALCQAQSSAKVKVNPGPGSTCTAAGANKIKIGDNKIEWVLTNDSSIPITIQSIDIKWPSSHGNLKKIKVEGDEIFKTELPPTEATVTTFINDIKKRQLKAHEHQKLIFEFAKKAKTTPGNYGITVTFAEGCEVAFNPGTTPGGGGTLTCSKPIDALTMKWEGTMAVDVVAWKGAIGSTQLATVNGIDPGDNVTISGFAGSPNDVYWQIFKAGTTVPYGTGVSTFHLSCSDRDMDDPSDCGKLEGDGKGLTGFVNEWRFRGMKDSDETLVCP